MSSSASRCFQLPSLNLRFGASVTFSPCLLLNADYLSTATLAQELSLALCALKSIDKPLCGGNIFSNSISLAMQVK